MTLPSLPDRPAGRPLDCEIAEKVFGYARSSLPGKYGPLVHYITPSGGWLRFSGSGSADQIEPPAMLPHYSESIADAWLVVERLRERGFHFFLNAADVDLPTVGTWYSRFDRDDDRGLAAFDASASLAICRAALLASEHSTGGPPGGEQP